MHLGLSDGPVLQYWGSLSSSAAKDPAIKLAQRHPLLCKVLDGQAQRGGYRFATRRDGGGVRGACARHVHKRLHSCGGAELGQGPLVFTRSH